MANSIRPIAVVHYIVGGHSWEGEVLVSSPAPFHAHGEKGSGQIRIGPMAMISHISGVHE